MVPADIKSDKEKMLDQPLLENNETSIQKKRKKKKKKKQLNQPDKIESNKSDAGIRIDTLSASEIFDTFFVKQNYDGAAMQLQFNKQCILEKLQVILKSHKDQMILFSKEDKDQLIQNLSSALSMKVETTGFLCFKKTIYTIVLDEIKTNEILNSCSHIQNGASPLRNP